MPSINAPAKVLLTGATGYLGLQLAKALLDGGYAVCGTVRSEEKGKLLKDLFKSDRLEYIVVRDIEAPGAFDEAVKGVEGIVHSASPLSHMPADPEVLINMAVEGTIGILKSTKAHGPNVKRIVITSSSVAVDYPVPGKRSFTEKDWNDQVVDVVREQGMAADPNDKYKASKTLAEHAAWDFMEKNKDSINFDITTACPPWIFGPMLHLESPSDISVSNGVLYGALTSEKKESELTALGGGWVDVRDISRIHVELLSIPEASNERYLTSAGEWTIQDMYDTLQEEPVISGGPIGKPGATKGKVHDILLDSSKLDALLGVPHEKTYRSLSESIRDIAAQFKEKGWF